MEERILTAKEFLDEIKDVSSGVYLIPSFGKIEMTLEVIDDREIFKETKNEDLIFQH